MLDMMVWVWLGVTALAAFVEAVTMTLVSVWCVAGGLVAVFILTAAVVRPLAKKYADPHKVATNADRLLGMEAKVTEDIDNARSSGAVYVDGKTWTARSTDGGRISAGETVEIAGMEGVKLIVRAKAADPTA